MNFLSLKCFEFFWKRLDKSSTWKCAATEGSLPVAIVALRRRPSLEDTTFYASTARSARSRQCRRSATCYASTEGRRRRFIASVANKSS